MHPHPKRGCCEWPKPKPWRSTERGRARRRRSHSNSVIGVQMDPAVRHRFAESWHIHPASLHRFSLRPFIILHFRGYKSPAMPTASLLSPPPPPSPPPTNSSTTRLSVPPRPVVVTRRCSSSTSRSSSPSCSLSPSSAPRPCPQSGPQRRTPLRRSVRLRHGQHHRNARPLLSQRPRNVHRLPPLLHLSVLQRPRHPSVHLHLHLRHPSAPSFLSRSRR